MHHHSPSILVLLTGPVGVGKSKTANAAARILRDYGMTTACVDLDQIYCMIRQSDGFDSQGTWLAARKATAALAEHFFEKIARVLIVEGGFITEAEQRELLDALRCKPRIEIITLHAPFDTVYARVMADSDPSRVASKVSTIFKQLYSEYETALPFLQKATKLIDVERCDLEQVALKVATIVLGGLPLAPA
jgi:shikimate kinase